MKDILDEVRKFYDDRIKSPFFLSVLGVWVFTNRVLVFGLFNFGEEVSAGARIDWVATQLSTYKMLGIFTGLYGSIFYSFLVGTFAMVLYNAIKNGSRALYKYIDMKTMWLVYNVKPNDFVNIDQRDSALARYKASEEELTKTTGKLIAANSELASAKSRAEEFQKRATESNLSSNKYYKTLRAILEEEWTPKPDYKELRNINFASDLFLGKWVIGKFYSGDAYSESEFEVQEGSKKFKSDDGTTYIFSNYSFDGLVLEIHGSSHASVNMSFILKLKKVKDGLFVGYWSKTVCVFYKKDMPWGFSIQ